MTALIVIGLFGLAILLIVAFLLALVDNAPSGYEDGDGFHYGVYEGDK